MLDSYPMLRVVGLSLRLTGQHLGWCLVTPGLASIWSFCEKKQGRRRSCSDTTLVCACASYVLGTNLNRVHVVTMPCGLFVQLFFTHSVVRRDRALKPDLIPRLCASSSSLQRIGALIVPLGARKVGSLPSTKHADSANRLPRKVLVPPAVRVKSMLLPFVTTALLGQVTRRNTVW